MSDALWRLSLGVAFVYVGIAFACVMLHPSSTRRGRVFVGAILAVVVILLATACGSGPRPGAGTRAPRDPSTTYVSPYAPGGLGARASAGRVR